MVHVHRHAPSPPDTGGPPFCVLLGPDGAGKSTALGRLREDAPPWRLLSVDDGFLRPEDAVIGRLRREVVRDGAEAWSPEFLTAMLQTAVVHLRDRLLRDDPARPAVVDSYYYKLLAKCRLAGVADNPMFDWWRAFPRPQRVIYLDVAPGSAWGRCRAGRDLNRLEHYGDRPDRDGFELYQRDLAKIMWDEIRDLPVTTIGEEYGPAETAEEIRKVLTDEFR
ncbi:dTMP kinase [Streptomyces lincolnensis]|uniref:dTMP kinase n=1 Tax=Streptomyces lincolnensis TaxID=1915 RepID=UPI0037D7B232